MCASASGGKPPYTFESNDGVATGARDLPDGRSPTWQLTRCE
jgi:hypothetical protein